MPVNTDGINPQNDATHFLEAHGYAAGIVPIKTLMLGDGSVMMTAASGVLQVGNGDPIQNTSGKISSANGTSATRALTGANGETITEGFTSEEVVLSLVGKTTDSVATILPANCFVSVTAYLTQTIDKVTSWEVGIAGTLEGFIPANTGLVAGTAVVGTGTLMGTFNPTAAKVRITVVGTQNDVGGKVRVSVYWRKLTAPTS